MSIKSKSILTQMAPHNKVAFYNVRAMVTIIHIKLYVCNILDRLRVSMPESN